MVVTSMTTTTTAPTTTLILTPDQHAQLRACLTALMDYAGYQRDCCTNQDADDSEAAHTAALDAAQALDLLDTAAADMAVLVGGSKMLDWASRVDGSVKH
jgi:hypothetical protein